MISGKVAGRGNQRVGNVSFRFYKLNESNQASVIWIKEKEKDLKSGKFGKVVDLRE